MSEWPKSDGEQQDAAQQNDDNGAPPPKKKKSARGSGSGAKTPKGASKKKKPEDDDPYKVVTPYVSIPPEHVLIQRLDDIRYNRGSVAEMVWKLLPPNALSVDRITPVLREDGSFAYIELRMLTKDHGKDYRTLFVADVVGSQDPNKNGIAMPMIGFRALAEQGLYVPTNTRELISAQDYVLENPELTLAIFWCEGDKAGVAVDKLLQTEEAKAQQAQRNFHAVASATIGGKSGVKETNYALRPRAGTSEKFIIDGVNSTPLFLDKAVHFIVRDNDQAGREEAHDLTDRLQKEYGVSLDRIHVVDPPDNAPEGWDDADPLPEGYTERDRVRQLFEATAVKSAWGKHQIADSWPDGRDMKTLRPKKGMRNCMIAIEDFGHTIQRDLFRQKDFFNGEVLSSSHLIELRDAIAGRFDFDGGKDNVIDAVQTLAQRNAYHPLLDYFNTLKWDGEPRIRKWMTTYLSAEDTPLTSEIGALMMIAAVRRVKQPGCKFDNIVVLEGGQGTGKSTALRILASDDYFSDVDIVHVPSKEQAERLQGVWWQEIAELVGMSKADINTIKNFASRQIDRARLAYARTVEDYPRTCILVGTTNETTYLRDQSGNRRFWPVRTGAIDLEALRRDRDQLWAEALQLEAEGAPLVLPESLWGDAAREQDARMTADYLEDVLDRLTPEECTLEGHNNEYYRVTYTTVMDFVQARTKENWSRINYTRLDHIMKKLGWETNKYVQCTVFENGVAKKRQARAFQRLAKDWPVAEEPKEEPYGGLPF